MQLINNKLKEFNAKNVAEILNTERKFITSLFSTMAFPTRAESDDEDIVDERDKSTHKPTLLGLKKSRATSISELQKRLHDMTGTRRKLSYKEKLQKKGLKTRMKKKEKRDVRNEKKKLIRAEKLSQLHGEIKDNDEIHEKKEPPKISNAKPVYNSEGKMVFSKFDFTGLGAKKEKKVEKDPKKLLKALQEQKETLKKLEAEGHKEKANQIKQKTAWKNAIAKVQGEKVRDDSDLLKKSVKKQEQRVKKSTKKWAERTEKVKQAKEDKQKKRTENLEKQKKEKKTKKMKNAVKRGKIIPGF